MKSGLGMQFTFYSAPTELGDFLIASKNPKGQWSQVGRKDASRQGREKDDVVVP
jgi:hypothetical protein